MRRLRWLSILLCALTSFAACEAQVWTFEGENSGRKDGGGSSGSECEADVCVCADEELACDNRCVNPRTDVEHCGGCNTRCAEGERCDDSRCACLPGYTRCGGLCVNLQNDLLHCGACNQPCAGGAQCRGGTCG